MKTKSTLDDAVREAVSAGLSAETFIHAVASIAIASGGALHALGHIDEIGMDETLARPMRRALAALVAANAKVEPVN